MSRKMIPTMTVIPPRERKKGETIAQTPLRLPADMLRRVDEIADAEGYSRNEVLVLFVTWALAQHERERSGAQGAADVATDLPRGTDELVPPGLARPPVDPAEVVKALEERLRAAETLGQLRTLMEEVERSGLPKPLKNGLYDVWMACDAAVRAGRPKG